MRLEPRRERQCIVGTQCVAQDSDNIFKGAHVWYREEQPRIHCQAVLQVRGLDRLVGGL